jgi:hypothetical protein
LGLDHFWGGAGIDVLNLTEASASVDRVYLHDVVSYLNRDNVTAFTTGSGGDVVVLNDSNTSNTTTGVQMQSTAQTNQGSTLAVTLTTASFDVFEFTTDAGSDNDLSSDSVGGGTALLDVLNANGTDVATLTTDVAGGSGYIVAYDTAGPTTTAYLYYFNAGEGDTSVATSEINLIGTFVVSAAGAFDTANFNFIA